jgi:hypothetical protein
VTAAALPNSPPSFPANCKHAKSTKLLESCWYAFPQLDAFNAHPVVQVSFCFTRERLLADWVRSPWRLHDFCV